jgi:peptidyl-prolyl cis-trans isomerase C
VGDQSGIRVSRAEIERLSEVWTRQYGRAPDSAEIKNLVDEYIREEILYREAIASGLDKGDTIIRRRLVEKMEFLSQELADADPSDNELLEYFNRNREKFRIPAQVAFSHTYFSTSKRGAAAESEAEHALRTLRRPSSPDASQLGDSFMLQSEYPAQTQEEIKGLFGEEFADNLFQLHLGTWEGPIRSSYGLHLVKISRYLPSRIPELAEVRNRVLTDFKNQQLQDASEAYYARLRSRYRVDVDNAALAAAQSPPKQPPNHSGARESATPDED